MKKADTMEAPWRNADDDPRVTRKCWLRPLCRPPLWSLAPEVGDDGGVVKASSAPSSDRLALVVLVPLDEGDDDEEVEEEDEDEDDEEEPALISPAARAHRLCSKPPLPSRTPHAAAAAPLAPRRSRALSS